MRLIIRDKSTTTTQSCYTSITTAALFSPKRSSFRHYRRLNYMTNFSCIKMSRLVGRNLWGQYIKMKVCYHPLQKVRILNFHSATTTQCRATSGAEYDRTAHDVHGLWKGRHGWYQFQRLRGEFSNYATIIPRRFDFSTSFWRVALHQLIFRPSFFVDSTPIFFD